MKATLSELIHACGKNFGALFPPHTTYGKGDTNDNTNWKAVGYVTQDVSLLGLGQTPEEAVNNLLIAISKNDAD